MGGGARDGPTHIATQEEKKIFGTTKTDRFFFSTSHETSPV